MKTAAIIPAAGSGKRMKLDHPKQFHLLLGVPILIHTVTAFHNCNEIDEIIVVVPSQWQKSAMDLLVEHGLGHDSIRVIPGGARRQDSVYEGLEALDQETEIVLVHDGARPLVTEDLIRECCRAAELHGAAIAALPVKDTLKRGNSASTIEATVNRENLWQAQTPQGAKVSLLKAAYQQAGNQDVTDEASLLELANIPVHLVEGAESNLKITRPEDLKVAETLLMKTATTPRIGHGFDAHKFAPNRTLVLGGVHIPYELGLAGHSDADVLTHALCDAILGALGEGDIGSHFPDSDQSFQDIYSIKLLERVMELATSRGQSLGNADITIICQAPKLAPFLPEMKEILAKACKTDLEGINIKATTTEKMGYTGRLEGISCHAVVLLT